MSNRLIRNKDTGVEWGINGVYKDRLVFSIPRLIKDVDGFKKAVRFNDGRYE